MGKPQPRLTAAIILILITAAVGAVLWTFKSTYSTTIEQQYAPSISDLVRAASLDRGATYRMLDRDLMSVVADLDRWGFSEDKSAPHAYIRRRTIPETGHLIDELVTLTVDAETGMITGASYIRMTDAPIKSPYLEVLVP